MKNIALTLLVCLVVLFGVTTAHAEEGFEKPAPTEWIAQWLGDLVDQARNAWQAATDAEPQQQSYVANGSTPTLPSAQPMTTGTTGEDPGDDGPALELGPLAEPAG